MNGGKAARWLPQPASQLKSFPAQRTISHRMQKLQLDVLSGEGDILLDEVAVGLRPHCQPRTNKERRQSLPSVISLASLIGTF